MTKSFCRRMIGLLLALCIALIAFAVFPSNAHAAVEYDLWVGGVQVTGDNYDHITGENIFGHVSFDPSSGTLRLINATIVGHAGLNQNAGIYSGSGMHVTIEPIGENYVFSADDNKGILPAIYADGSLTLCGEGNLFAFGYYRANKPVGRSSYGVCVRNGRLTIANGTYELYGDWTPGANSYGVFAKEILVTGGNTEAVASSGTYKQELKKYLAQPDGSTKTVTTDKVFVSNGVGMYGAITISGGNVIASGGRFAIGRTPVLKNISAQGSYRTDGAYTRTFIPCDYEDYVWFSTSAKAPDPIPTEAASVPRTGDGAPLALLTGLIVLSAAALAIRRARRGVSPR